MTANRRAQLQVKSKYLPDSLYPFMNFVKLSTVCVLCTRLSILIAPVPIVACFVLKLIALVFTSLYSIRVRSFVSESETWLI